MSEDSQGEDFDALLGYLKKSRGFDFSGYKRAGLARRIERRMQTIGCPDFASYVDILEANPDEFAQLFNTVLINVTGFFRDGDPWDFIASDVVPRIIAAVPPDEPIRAWSAGCATGQEAYTLAMVFAEALGPDRLAERVKIYATDVDEEALSIARAGVYTERDVEGIPPALLERYFTRTDTRLAFRKDLRRAVIFGRNDLVRNAPISHIDLLACRNTLMYFDARSQAQMLARFHFALNDHGFLFLGRAETLLTHSESFAPVDLKRRVFSRRPAAGRGRTIPPAPRTDKAGQLTPDAAGAVRDLALHYATVAQIIIDQNGALLMANERARTLFRLTTGDLGRPLQDLTLSYRPFDLRTAIDQAYSERRTVAMRSVPWRTELEERFFDMDIVPLPGRAGVASGVTITFADVTRQKDLERDVDAARAELNAAYEELQSVNEELETTNEELQSTVEELETTNEELQSTNEELETMNAELQATNEHLHSTNDGLRRTDPLPVDMSALQESIFTSLRAGVIVVDRQLQVIVWNNWAEELWGVRAADVEGRHIAELDVELPFEPLRAAITACLERGECGAGIAISGKNRRGKAVSCNVTCLPLRDTGDAVVNGVILVLDRIGGDGGTAHRVAPVGRAATRR